MDTKLVIALLGFGSSLVGLFTAIVSRRKTVIHRHESAGDGDPRVSGATICAWVFGVSAVAALAAVGLILAVQVTAVHSAREVKPLTVKDDETAYKVTDEVVVRRGDKDAKSEDSSKNPVVSSGKLKLDITTDGDKVTEIHFRPGKKKSTD